MLYVQIIKEICGTFNIQCLNYLLKKMAVVTFIPLPKTNLWKNYIFFIINGLALNLIISSRVIYFQVVLAFIFKCALLIWFHPITEVITASKACQMTLTAFLVTPD